MHTHRKVKIKSWEDPVEIGEKRLYTHVMSEPLQQYHDISEQGMALRRSETSASLAKIKDRFTVKGEGIQSHSSKIPSPSSHPPQVPDLLWHKPTAHL